MSAEPAETFRPRDLARLLLASGDVLPRQRARDQQADRAGLDLKRRLLEWVVAADPAPADLEAALVQAVADIGPPTGPTRSIAVAFREEWQAAAASPRWVAHLRDEAVRQSAEGPRRGRRLSS